MAVSNITLRYVVSDCLTILKKETANADLTEAQVQYWAVTIANKLRFQHILKSPTGRYLNIYTNIPVQISSTSTNPDLVKNRKYVDLPEAVYDMMAEKGINYICHTQDGTCPPEFMGLLFQPTSPSTAYRLNYSPYEEPSPKNPYFYRTDNNRIYFLGLETVNVRSLEMGLYTSIDMRTNRINIDSPLDLTEQHIDILRAQLLSLGSFSSAIPKDRTNDASNLTDQPLKPSPVPAEQASE